MDTNTIATLILVGSFLAMVFMRFPVAFCLGISSFLTVLYLGLPLQLIAQNVVNGISSFSLLAVPFFIITGQIMGDGGIADKIIKLANALVGWMRGGVAMVNIVDSMFFGGISGSATADVASLGTIIIPMMKKQGYSAEFAANLTVTTSVQALLIPPSHNMVIFAMAAGGVSIGKLFMGGIVPGIFLGLALMIYTYYLCIKHNYPKGDPFSFKALWKALKEAVLGMVTVLIVVVGVTAGICTATEAAGLAVVWSFVVTFLVYREIPLKRMWGILGDSLRTVSMVMILLGTSSAFAFLLAYLQVPKMIASVLIFPGASKVVTLLIMNVMLLVFGMFMDMAPIIIISTPILLPIATALGVDPVHFGIVMILNLGIGLITPPVGNCLFLGSAISGVPIARMTKTLLPFYAVMIAVLLAITFIPEIVMFLPNLIYG